MDCYLLNETDICGLVLSLMSLSSSVINGEQNVNKPSIITSGGAYSIIGMKYVTPFCNDHVLEFYTIKKCGEKGKIVFSSNFMLLKYERLLECESENFNSEYNHFES